MTAYATGTITVTNGSVVVDGAGTNFLPPNIYPGDFLVTTADGKLNEVGTIESGTRLRLVRPFVGAPAGGQAYFIVPAQSHEGDLALRAASLLNSFGAVVDGIGQGLIPSGTVAAPGLRFSADQDTGFRRVGENSLALVVGGVDRLIAKPAGIAVAGSGLITAHVGSETNSSFRGFTAGDVAGTVYGGLRMELSLGEMRLESGFAGFGGFQTIYTNGVERVRIDTAGSVGIGTTAPSAKLDVVGDGVNIFVRSLTANPPSIRGHVNGGEAGGIVFASGGGVVFTVGGGERGRFDATGNLLVGVSSGAAHTFKKAVTAGGAVLVVGAPGLADAVTINAVDAAGASGAGTAIIVGRNAGTNRSINAGGTINAGGNDYAEYMHKAQACGVLAKGQVIGIDAKGTLTDKFSLAHTFMIKSTDPSYVGGDTWSPGPPPAEPILALPAYKGPPEPTKPGAAPAGVAILGEKPIEPVQQSDEELLDFIRRMARWINEDADWVKAMNDHPAQVEAHAMAETAHVAAKARFKLDLTAWQKAMAAHAADVAAAEKKHAEASAKYKAGKAAWDVSMEAARSCVDRIAFSGQVPCNVAAGTFKPGDYIVGSKGKNDEIVGLVIANAVMRLNPGHRCDAVGKVWRVMEDGRAWVAVLIG